MRPTPIPVRYTRTGELAVPPKKATTNASTTGRKPIDGSTENFVAAKIAATPARNVLVANTTT